MFGRFALPGSFNNMMTNIRSFLSNIVGIVTEVRDFVQDDPNSEGNVRNKRIKLSSSSNDEPRWVDAVELGELVTAFEELDACLFQAVATIERHPDRRRLETLLRPLVPAMGFSSSETGLLLLGRGPADITHFFCEFLRETLSRLHKFYEVKSLVEVSRVFPTVPEVFDWNNSDEDIMALGRIKQFLSAPAFPTICNRLLGYDAPDGETYRISTEFIDLVILDIEANLMKLPLPSYVVSPYYQDRLRSSFPRPERTDMETHLLLPGAFPDNDEPEQPEQLTEGSPVSMPSTPRHTPPSRPSVLTRPYLSEAPPPRISKTERIRAEFELSATLRIKSEEYNLEHHQDDDNHRSIQLDYHTGHRGDRSPKPARCFHMRDLVPPRGNRPLNLAADVRQIGSILRNKRKHVSKTTPKRLVREHIKTVRFEPSIISPTRRTHHGREIPRRCVRQRQYRGIHDTQDPHLVTTGSPPRVADSSPAAHPSPVAESSAMGAARGLAHLDEDQHGDSPVSGSIEDSSPGSDEYEQWFGRQHAARTRRVQQKTEEAQAMQAKKDKEQADRIARADACIEELFSLPSVLRISDDRRDDIATQREQAAEKAAEEARRAEEERVQKELEAKLARTGGLRDPKQCFVAPVDAEWSARARDTLRASPTTTLASTAEGVDLRRHDFCKVVPPSEWLNDEIVNGSLNWLDRAINSAAGIKDVKKQTRKCLAMSSFFLKRLKEQGVSRTQRTLRRYGVEKKNLLDIDTILVPICERSHWTLLVIRPRRKTVAHMDSLNPRGSAEYTSLAKAWMKDVLEDLYVEDEWKIVQHEAPRQVNGHDCGVHTITNAMCLALGLNPIDSYDSDDMPAQRIRLACMLLNGGFKGDFDLRVY